MLRIFLLTASITAAFCVIQPASAHAMGGNLRRPGIAIPTTGKGGKLDPTAAAINEVLGAHEKQFAGGHFINAHSVLHFTGGAKTINALLDELSQIDGAVLWIEFSKEAGSAASPFPDKEKQPKVCDCTIDHNAWLNANWVTITIYLGGDVTRDEVTLPDAHNRAKVNK
jgi:hypothetical protein